ncbi:hypothetical protein [Methylobacterium planeticum]|uniref:PilZ domain-containing protein n=1 Tax=Methylobacterium planeticum TaxID=2615211 RepID=A0A6N6MIB4_9HYPH|nr:hypothetical protein [Methylobacterium planeticum]KAB1068486.1 hypothetical protein F6X51_26880 [Methylobacterium planeticum]
MTRSNRMDADPENPRAGELFIAGSRPALKVRVLSFSDEGPEIEVDSPLLLSPGELPRQCHLRAPLMKIDRPCRTVWRWGRRFGLSFAA